MVSQEGITYRLLLFQNYFGLPIIYFLKQGSVLMAWRVRKEREGRAGRVICSSGQVTGSSQPVRGKQQIMITLTTSPRDLEMTSMAHSHRAYFSLSLKLTGPKTDRGLGEGKSPLTHISKRLIILFVE